MILGINIQEPNNQFQLYLILGNQEKNNIMIPNTNKNMNIGKYNIVIVGDTINVTSYIVTKVLYQKGKEGKLNKVKRILTMINDISYSIGKTKKIIEQNILINTTPKPLNNNNNTASPLQTDHGHVLARANRKCTPGHVTMNKRGIGQSMKHQKIRKKEKILEITFTTHVVCRSEWREKKKLNIFRKGDLLKYGSLLVDIIYLVLKIVIK